VCELSKCTFSGNIKSACYFLDLSGFHTTSHLHVCEFSLYLINSFLYTRSIKAHANRELLEVLSPWVPLWPSSLAAEKTTVNLRASTLDVSEPDLAGVSTTVCLRLPTDGRKETTGSPGSHRAGGVSCREQSPRLRRGCILCHGTGRLPYCPSFE